MAPTVTAATGSDVRAAIARAAQATGVDFSYLLGQARLESRLDPTARAATSSATGLYQFTDATWLATLSKHGGALGLSADAAVPRAQIMALRTDPGASALMAAELAGDNQTALTTTLGRAPDSTELYLAHFLGADGAGKFLSALAADPTQSAAALLPRAAASNAGVFYDASGAARSVGDVMGLLRTRLTAAMADTPGGATMANAAFSPAPQPTGGPIATAFAAARDMAVGAATTSMADTLSATFALGDGGAPAPGFIRAAYGKMQALGL